MSEPSVERTAYLRTDGTTRGATFVRRAPIFTSGAVASTERAPAPREPPRAIVTAAPPPTRAAPAARRKLRRPFRSFALLMPSVYQISSPPAHCVDDVQRAPPYSMYGSWQTTSRLWPSGSRTNAP